MYALLGFGRWCLSLVAADSAPLWDSHSVMLGILVGLVLLGFVVFALQSVER